MRTAMAFADSDDAELVILVSFVGLMIGKMNWDMRRMEQGDEGPIRIVQAMDRNAGSAKSGISGERQKAESVRIILKR